MMNKDASNQPPVTLAAADPAPHTLTQYSNSSQPSTSHAGGRVGIFVPDRERRASARVTAKTYVYKAPTQVL